MKTKEELQAMLVDSDMVAPIGRYHHYKGGEYILYSKSVHEGELIVLCHYYSLERKVRWTRTLENFVEPVWVSTIDADNERQCRPRFKYQCQASLQLFLEACGIEMTWPMRELT